MSTKPKRRGHCVLVALAGCGCAAALGVGLFVGGYFLFFRKAPAPAVTASPTPVVAVATSTPVAVVEATPPPVAEAETPAAPEPTETPVIITGPVVVEGLELGASRQQVEKALGKLEMRQRYGYANLKGQPRKAALTFDGPRADAHLQSLMNARVLKAGETQFKLGEPESQDKLEAALGPAEPTQYEGEHAYRFLLDQTEVTVTHSDGKYTGFGFRRLLPE